MRSYRNLFFLLVVALGFSTWTAAQDAASSSSPAQTPGQVPGSLPADAFDRVLDRVIEREHFFLAQMRRLHPLVETYIQNLKPDSDLDAVPASDQYFLGRMDLSEGTNDRSFLQQGGIGRRILNRVTSLYSMRFLPLGFAQMAILDSDFQRKNYYFSFVRREFLGEVRCLVIDVQPKPDSGTGRFVGRIWVEDQDYNIVRFNGTYAPHPRYSYYLHFDSWRLNLRPGVWLPAYIYSEESDLHYRISRGLRFKAQTRLWGYDTQRLGRSDEFTQILVDSPQDVRDQSEASRDASPVESQRAWERQAEVNALERLQQIGLLAPPGEVDKVLQTVVNNLLVSNNLDVQPDVRCRVLLTSPLESFPIGRTIVVSRGLLDVLPDEPSLAAVLAHEVSHVLLGHRLDTQLAFNDRLFFPDEKTFDRLDFKRNPAEEDAADRKAVDLLSNSPYKDKLNSVGLFLKAVQARAPQLKNLIRPHLGDSLGGGKDVRLAALVNSAPQLEMRRVDQIAALPLGGRIKLDPWSNRIELLKTKPVPVVSAREKMPFEVTPFYPYLTRLATNSPEKAALTPPAQ